MEFADGLDVGYEKKKGDKDVIKGFSLSNSKDGVGINWDRAYLEEQVWGEYQEFWFGFEKSEIL